MNKYYIKYPGKNSKMKIKIEIEDGKTKSNLVLENEDKETVKQKLDFFIDFAYSTKNPHQITETSFKPEFLPQWISEYDIHNLSQKEKLYILLEREHQGEWVRSQDVKEEYENIWGDEIKLSSLSTYLARFHDKGEMERRGSRAQREYKFFPGIRI